MSSHDQTLAVATLVKTPALGGETYAWTIHLGSAQVDLVVVNGQRQRLSITPASDDPAPVRISSIMREIGITDERDARILSVTTMLPSTLESDIMFPKVESDQNDALNALLMLIGKFISDVAT